VVIESINMIYLNQTTDIILEKLIKIDQINLASVIMVGCSGNYFIWNRLFYSHQISFRNELNDWFMKADRPMSDSKN